MTIRSIVDGATILRASDAAAIAATPTNTTPLSLEMLTPNYPANSEADYIFKAVIHNVVLGGDVVPTAVTVNIQVDDDTDFGSPVTVATQVVTAGGTFEVPLSLHQIRKMKPAAKALRLNVVMTGGTNPTVDFGAYLTKP